MTDSRPRIPRLRVPKTASQHEALERAFGCGALVRGDELDAFASRLREIYGRRHCVLTSSGYAALFVSLRALELDRARVLIPPVSTCFAIHNAVCATGNEPLHCDVDGSSANLDPVAARSVHESRGFDAIVSPHHFGIPSAVASLRKLGVPVIADGAQAALTCRSRGDERATALILSFYPTKLLNAIDGGAILTDDDDLARRCREIVYYDHQVTADGVARYNFRLANLHAAVGLASLSELDGWKRELDAIACRYRAVAATLDGAELLGSTSPGLGADVTPWRCVLRFRASDQKRAFERRLGELGIDSSEELVPVAEPIETFPVAASLLETTLSLPYFPGLSTSDLDRVEESMAEAQTHC